MGLFSKIFGTYSQRQIKKIKPTVDKIEALADEYSAMTDAQLRAKTDEFKERLANGQTLDDHIFICISIKNILPLQKI